MGADRVFNNCLVLTETFPTMARLFHMIHKDCNIICTELFVLNFVIGLQSGAGICEWAYTDLDKARAQALIVGEECGCDTSDTMAMVECLRTKDTQTIYDAGDVVRYMVSSKGCTRLIP